MDPTGDEEDVATAALIYARKNKKKVAKRLTDPKRFPPDANPVSVFMAGSPGAGKTEASIELLEQLDNTPTIRIDIDDLRKEFAAYDGSNASLFQGGASVLLEKMQDFALEQRQSFVLDGTLSNYRIAEANVRRSLRKGREVLILYVYQEPDLAWSFAQAREVEEGRHVDPADFVDQYFRAREVVNRLKAELGRKVRVDLLFKNLGRTKRFFRANVDRIDPHIPEKYTREDVERIVDLR